MEFFFFLMLVGGFFAYKKIPSFKLKVDALVAKYWR